MAWVVVIEQVQGVGQKMRWAASQIKGDFPDREQARAEALRLCGQYVPNHPWSERRRRVYRRSPDSYLVHIAGATTEFHFNLSVAERIVPETGEPDAFRPPEEGAIPQGDRFFAP